MPYSAKDSSIGVRQEWRLSVNRDFHQNILDLSDTAIGSSPNSLRRYTKQVYELPFRVHPTGGRALVVGAGTGNDVMAALREGYHQVVSVEIDPKIMELGKQYHPEHPYTNPRVALVLNDARAYFEQNPQERFDVICYGLLDSHAMFSAMSSLRLDNYVYTKEGIESAWKHVKDDGVLSVSFSVYAGKWVEDRIFATMLEATGILPIKVYHGVNYGMTFLVGRHLKISDIPPPFQPIPVTEVPNIRIPTDDWPFLYLHPGKVPYAYLCVLSLIAITTALAVRKVFGKAMFTSEHFHLPLFFMGAAFMLLETRMVTELSLLFGSTWVVNSSVFASILFMVLIANWIVSRYELKRLEWAYLPLWVSLLATWVTGAGMLNKLSLLNRGIVGGLLYALPVAFAGIIFSCLLKRSKYPASALGANLLGAVVGGILEYTSMFVGLRAIALMALAFYLASYLFAFRKGMFQASLSHNSVETS